MDIYSVDEEPGWFTSVIHWGRDLWEYWTAPSPDKLPFDRSVLRTRLELCLTRMKVLRRNIEPEMKRGISEYITMAKEESAMAPIKVMAHFSKANFLKTLDLLEPQLILLCDSVDLPTHDASPILAVRNVLYAAAHIQKLPELDGIRQQLLQKYNPIIGLVKVELLDQELVKLCNPNQLTVDTYTWLNKNAPGKCWAQKLEEALAQQEIQDSASHVKPDTFDPSHTDVTTIEIPDGPDQSDDDDHPTGGLGNSHDSGPTDSPIPPLNVYDFPSVPTQLYPVLSLSDSLERPQTSQPTLGS